MKYTEEEKLAALSRLEALTDRLPIRLWCKDTEGHYVTVNQAMADSVGLEKVEVIGKTDIELFDPISATERRLTDLEAMQQERSVFTEIQNRDRVEEEYKRPLYNTTGRMLGTAGFSRDVTHHKQVRDSLIESERSMSVLLSNLPGVAYRSNQDSEFTMTFISNGCKKLTGYSAEQLIAKNPSYYELIHPDHRERLFERWRESVECNLITTDEYPIVTATGEIKWVWEQSQEVYDAAHHLVATEGLIIDVTERKCAEEKIYYLSYHDQLTGLYNRRFYEEELIRLDTERNLPITLVMADVNGLKLINDAFGHSMGDELIKKVAETIKRECRADDIIARIGGDEFILLLPKTDGEEAKRLVDRIRMAISRENINYIICSASFGWATKSDLSQNILDISTNAEDFMYSNKLTEGIDMRNQTIKAVTKTLYGKNKKEQKHCERVGELCVALGKALHMGPEDLNELKAAGVLHDIGLIGVDEHLFDQHGNLFETESPDFKRHAEIGYQLLRSVSEFAPIAEYVLYHHERIDGKGYPRGLAGEEIPLKSRIVSIANMYDALTSSGLNRKRAMSSNEAASHILQNAGTQFDGTLAHVFIEQVIGLHA